MGTNYYLRIEHGKPCPTCERGIDTEEIHIGKSSAGWAFTFHATDEIKSAKVWKETTKEGKIFDEYGIEHSYKEFWELIESKKDAPHNHARELKEGSSFLDEEGNSFSPYEFS